MELVLKFQWQWNLLGVCTSYFQIAADEIQKDWPFEYVLTRSYTCNALLHLQTLSICTRICGFATPKSFHLLPSFQSCFSKEAQPLKDTFLNFSDNFPVLSLVSFFKRKLSTKLTRLPTVIGRPGPLSPETPIEPEAEVVQSFVDLSRERVLVRNGWNNSTCRGYFTPVT